MIIIMTIIIELITIKTIITAIIIIMVAIIPYNNNNAITMQISLSQISLTNKK